MPSHSAPLVRAKSLLHPVADFWLLGGASILVWLTLVLSGLIRETPSVGQRMMQLGIVFSFLALICNHPHFMISYRIAYSRGIKFIFEKWFALLFIPGLMIAAYLAAYLFFDTNISSSSIVSHLNSCFEFIGIGFRLGLQANLGTEILGLGGWFMYLTVGWHYAKQVFGCLMVYSYFEKYPLSQLQRRILKSSVFSVAFLQFTSVTVLMDKSVALAANEPAHTQAVLTPLQLPQWLYTFSYALVGVTFFAALVLVFWRNYSVHKRLPSATFIVPWLAFHIWWVPLFRQMEFTFMIIPFFHSLQYLPFAYRVEIPKVKKNRLFGLNLGARVVILLIIGFVAFEALPNFLDSLTDSTATTRVPWFFLSAFVVFINVHHFFIDSAIWKFNQPDVFESVLHVPSETQPQANVSTLAREAS